MIMSLRIVAILCLLEVCRAYTPAANNPPMLTHASMDVGNIISIVIPESPDENINVEQLTGEFRQQLERIKKQSRASKVEHGLVTLKRVLPEMSREEKRKTLPLIRRVLHGRRVSNSGSMKNWTREAQRLDQMSEGGQFVRSRLAGKPEEKKNYRDYEETGNREGVTTRIAPSVADKDDYHRVIEETNANRREEAPREDPIRHSDQIRQEELSHYDDQSRREDRVNVPDEEQSSSKIARPGNPQEWNNPNLEDQSQGDTQICSETSTVDCNYKSDRAVRQKEPANEILQNDRYDKLGRISELEQQIASRYPVPRLEGTDNTKRNVKDGREYRLTDLAGFVNYPREYDMNESLNPDCDGMKRNGTGQSMEYEGNRDVSFDKQRLEAMNFERENSRGLPKVIEETRGHFERSNASGLENIVSESVGDYTSKKKRGHGYSNDFRRFSSIKSNRGDRIERWNMPIYDDRQAVNSSDDTRGSANVYEMFGEKEINPAMAYIQTDQSNFRSNLDNEPKMGASQHFSNYRSAGRILRIQRAANGEHNKNETSEFPSNVTKTSRENDGHHMNETLFERLNRLFKSAKTPKVIFLYANGSESHNEKTRKAFREAAKPQSTVFSSMVEPTTSTSHEVSVLMKSTTSLPLIQTTDNLVTKPHVIGKS